MKKRESYDIIINGKTVFRDLGQTEYFERMEDLALEFYQNGIPRPEDIDTVTHSEEN